MHTALARRLTGLLYISCALTGRLPETNSHWFRHSPDGIQILVSPRQCARQSHCCVFDRCGWCARALMLDQAMIDTAAFCFKPMPSRCFFSNPQKN